jgi:hypothetical protein
MTPKDKTKDRAPREAPLGPLLDRLKPGEAATVLRRLLKAHPDLSSEAYEIARSLLRQLEYDIEGVYMRMEGLVATCSVCISDFSAAVI